ncbi:MAG: hypothetical protein LBV52_00985, partial [Spirochaetaceae bacterium]|nr:hypothetical protein [Spirochaetaceae bacterium]
MNMKNIVLCCFYFWGILFCANSLDRPAHSIQFTGSKNQFFSFDTVYWASNHEIILEDWYFNRNTDQFIPPYLGSFMALSPYDGKTLVYLSKKYFYLFDIDSYAKGIPPEKTTFPAEIQFVLNNVQGACALWIDRNEILFVFFTGDNDTEWGKIRKYIIYSTENCKFKIINEDKLEHASGLKYFTTLKNYTNNRIIIGGLYEEMPFDSYQLYDYIPKTNEFISKAEFSENGFSSMISPEPVKINDEMVELYYDFNIMENNKSYYTTTYKNTFLVFDMATEKIINQYQIFTLPAWQYHGETLLSPNGFSFAVLVRDEIIDGRTTHDPPLKYFIFDTRLESSYSWT